MLQRQCKILSLPCCLLSKGGRANGEVLQGGARPYGWSACYSQPICCLHVRRLRLRKCSQLLSFLKLVPVFKNSSHKQCPESSFLTFKGSVTSNSQCLVTAVKKRTINTDFFKFHNVNYIFLIYVDYLFKWRI